jgi:hypothetical protein
LGQKVEVRDYESRGGWRQEKDAGNAQDEGGRRKDEKETGRLPFSSFILAPSSFMLSGFPARRGPQNAEADVGFVEM